jgi:DNA-binding transcriptional MocR family regulator
VGVYPLSVHMIEPPQRTDALVLGYANLAEPAIAEGIRRLALVLDHLQAKETCDGRHRDNR